MCNLNSPLTRTHHLANYAPHMNSLTLFMIMTRFLSYTHFLPTSIYFRKDPNFSLSSRRPTSIYFCKCSRFHLFSQTHFNLFSQNKYFEFSRICKIIHYNTGRGFELCSKYCQPPYPTKPLCGTIPQNLHSKLKYKLS